MWTKSSFCDSGACVEAAAGPDNSVLIRDSKNPSGPVLAFSDAEWQSFLDGVHNREFDRTSLPSYESEWRS